MDNNDRKPLDNHADSTAKGNPLVENDEVSQSYEVGYRKPPADTRFKRGQSGNPRGRPKGSLNLKTIFAKELRESIVGTENGRRKKFKTAEAIVKRLTTSAVSGNVKALDMSLKLWSATTVEEAHQPLEEEDKTVWKNLVDRIKSTDSE